MRPKYARGANATLAITSRTGRVTAPRVTASAIASIAAKEIGCTLHEVRGGCHSLVVQLHEVVGRIDSEVAVGGCIGTDAHTVGIDAILNIKGFAGEKGLEYYSEIHVVNLGAQVLVPDLVERARQENADAVLVSQVVTQRDAHIHNTTQMSAAFREAYPAGQVPLLIAGGPRFEEGSAAALGVDRIFGKGTTPSEVASYLVHALTGPDTGGRGGVRPDRQRERTSA